LPNVAKAKISCTPTINDTLIVNSRAAVFITPDSLQMEERRKQVGEDNFQIGMDDYAFYMNEAYEFLSAEKMTILETTGKKYIKFLLKDKAPKLIQIEKLPELWSIYFFDPRKRAKEIDMINIKEAYKNYFK